MSHIPKLQVFPHDSVAALLPERATKKCESDVNATKAWDDSLKNWKIEDGKKTNKKEIITALAGACILLLGVFLVLTFHQILPFGIHSLEGQIAGYICLSVGVIALLVASVKLCINRTHNTKVDGLMNTYHLAETAEMAGYFPNRLQSNELFAVDDPSDKILTIYSKEWNEEYKAYESATPIVIDYTTTPQAKLQSWWNENQTLVQDKHFIDLNELEKRTQTFEEKRQGKSQEGPTLSETEKFEFEHQQQIKELKKDLSETEKLQFEHQKRIEELQEDLQTIKKELEKDTSDLTKKLNKTKSTDDLKEVTSTAPSLPSPIIPTHETDAQLKKRVKNSEHLNTGEFFRQLEQESDARIEAGMKKLKEEAEKREKSSPAHKKVQLIKAWRAAKVDHPENCIAIEQQLKELGCDEDFIANLEKKAKILGSINNPPPSINVPTQTTDQMKTFERIEQENDQKIKEAVAKSDAKIQASFNVFKEAVQQSAANPNVRKMELMTEWKVAHDGADKDRLTDIEMQLRALGCDEDFIAQLPSIKEAL